MMYTLRINFSYTYSSWLLCLASVLHFTAVCTFSSEKITLQRSVNREISKRDASNSNECSPDIFHRCNNGTCLEKNVECDGHPDCLDHSDETAELCKYRKCSEDRYRCKYGGCLPNALAACNGIKECLDGSDETADLCNTPCPNDTFTCKYGGCLNKELLCNGIVNCFDGSDEIKDFCQSIKCPDDKFRCRYGGCLENWHVCDGIINCIDGSDETTALCKKLTCTADKFSCKYGGCLSKSRVCDGIVNCFDSSDETRKLCQKESCPNDKFRCKYGGCLDKLHICDGIVHCIDASDETKALCKNRTCSNDKFRCKYGGCLEKQWVCDGVPGCSDKSDETADLCGNNTCSEDTFRCEYGGCLDKWQVCDGGVECIDGSDESEASCELKSKYESPTTCALPLKYQNQKYVVICRPGHGNCSSTPGANVPELTEIRITCNPGYAFENLDILKTSCVKGVWVPLLENCKRRCEKLNNKNEDIKCYRRTKLSEIYCNRTLFEGTIVTMACKQHYRLEQPVFYNEITCNSKGEWSKPLFKCVPECGKPIANSVPLIVHGTQAKYGESPWHVAVYEKMNAAESTCICGGTIISALLVISAAHCFYDEKTQTEKPASKYEIAVSKLSINYDIKDTSETKIFKVRHIFYHNDKYRAALTHFDRDIVILLLDQEISFNAAVLPACLYLEEKGDFNPGENKTGKLYGWGLTTKGRASDYLLTADLPYISRKECLNIVNENFRNQITLDKFCAGSRSETGPGAKQGDSGGGLVFEDPLSHLFYLRGVVSNKDKTSKTGVAAFTDLSKYTDWINEKLNMAERKILKY